jgi:hypothetical protein
VPAAPNAVSLSKSLRDARDTLTIAALPIDVFIGRSIDRSHLARQAHTG